MGVARVLFFAAGIAVLGLGMYPGLLGDVLFASIFIVCGIVPFFLSVISRSRSALPSCSHGLPSIVP